MPKHARKRTHEELVDDAIIELGERLDELEGDSGTDTVNKRIKAVEKLLKNNETTNKAWRSQVRNLQIKINKLQKRVDELEAQELITT